MREAIGLANRVSGADNIKFNISGSGVQTITPASPLPTITDTVTIRNGYSQQGASAISLDRGTNANILIELNLANAGGPEIEANNTVVRGLVINNSRGTT